MMDLEKIAALARSAHLGPRDIICLNYFVTQVEDEDLQTYVEGLNPKEPEEFRRQMDGLFLVNAYLRELQHRKQDQNVGEVRTLLRERRELSDIVTQSALILSKSLSEEEYDSVVKKTKKDIEKEIRRTQLAQIKKRLWPFAVFTSKQYYSRLVLMGTLFATAAGLYRFSQTQEERYLIEYAREHRLVQEANVVGDDLRNPELEERFSRFDSGQYSPRYKNWLLDSDLHLISQLSITLYNSNAMDRDSYKQKKEKLQQFITVNKDTPQAVQARFQLAELVKQGQVLHGLSDTWIQEARQAFEEGEKMPGFITLDHIELMYNLMYEYEAQRYGRAEDGQRAALRWIEPYLNQTNSTGVFANLFMADLQSQKKPGKHPLPKDLYEAKRSYRFVARHTINSERYAYAVEQLMVLDESEGYGGRGLLGRLEDYKAIAKYAKDDNSRGAALLRTGEIYFQLKDYDRANSYFHHLTRVLPKDNALRTKALELIIEKVWWRELKDSLF